MMSESGVRANAHNPNGNASGLIQFMPQTLLNLGWTEGHAAFRERPAHAQLLFVRAYFMAHKGHLGSIAQIYTATFLPALVSHAGDPRFVLTAKNGPLGWAFGPNAVFDTNHDYAITVQELTDAVNRNCHGFRWNEIIARLTGSPVEPLSTMPPAFDLRTTRGIQEALLSKGFDPGPIDGIPGRLTTAAVMAFQGSHGLKPDGIVGPLTRDALGRAL